MLRDDALAIWQAAVDAVASDRLVQQNLRVEGPDLVAGPHRWRLNPTARVLVVGTGKAGAGMAAASRQPLGPSSSAAIASAAGSTCRMIAWRAVERNSFLSREKGTESIPFYICTLPGRRA